MELLAICIIIILSLTIPSIVYISVIGIKEYISQYKIIYLFLRNNIVGNFTKNNLVVGKRKIKLIDSFYFLDNKYYIQKSNGEYTLRLNGDIYTSYNLSYPKCVFFYIFFYFLKRKLEKIELKKIPNKKLLYLNMTKQNRLKKINQLI